MKVHLLCSDPFDEGWDVYGAFSTEEKANRAADIFKSKSQYELFVSSFEVDELENYFDKASSEYYLYNLYKRHRIGKWNVSSGGRLDSWIEYVDHPPKNHILETSALWCTVTAKSEEEAIVLADKLLEGLDTMSPDEHGWRFLEDEDTYPL